jgi:hypothetical protein
MNCQFLHRQISFHEIWGWLSRRQVVAWHHYMSAAVVAYLLPWCAVFVETALTWRHQMHLAMHFGFPRFVDPVVWLWMVVPAAITFVILLPFIRYPISRRIVSICIVFGWILFLLLNEAETK